MTEFRSLQARLEEVKSAMLATACGLPDSERLASLDRALSLLTEITPRAEVFEKRARETHEDRKIYGPGMTQKVLCFCEEVQLAASHASELAQELAPVRLRVAAADAAAADEARARREKEEEERRAAQQQASEASAAEEKRAPPEQTSLKPLQRMDGAASQRTIVHGMTLDEALALLQKSCDASALADALQGLHLLCANIVAHPDDPRFRTIRLLNPHFQTSVASRPGGLEALVALGFGEHESMETEVREAACWTRLLHSVFWV